MRALILFLAIALPLHLEAKTEKKINLKPQHGKSEDPGSATHLIYESPKNSEKASEVDGKGKIVAGQNCTDQLGMIYKKGDNGYEGCLRTMDAARPESSDQRRKSVGITIGR